MTWGPYYTGAPPQGWQCPCCRRVYSPTTAMCMFCQPGNGKVGTNAAPRYADPLKAGSPDWGVGPGAIGIGTGLMKAGSS